jgi:putative membrane protein
MPKWLKVYLSGVLMGAADVVPGVSGGTIAFILGVYERLINALSGVNKDSLCMLFKGNVKALWQHFDGAFLLSLGAGIVTSIFLLAGLITHLLLEYPSYLWSFFFGLILASAYFLISQIEGFTHRHFAGLIVGIGIGSSLSLLVPTQLNTSLIMVFFSGMIAICAMILPGISGSFLLLMMGMYGFILSAVKSVDLAVIATFAAGALIGLLSFSKILRYLLNHVRSMTLSVLTGVMLGALVKVWPWKVTDEWALIGDKKYPIQEHLILPWNGINFYWPMDFLLPVVFVFMGFLSVVLISYIFLRKDTNVNNGL